MTDETYIPEGEDALPEMQSEEAASDGAMIAALEAEVAGLKEQVLRFAADAENTKRRAEREANDARAFAIQKFARDLLGVADNLSRALSSATADDGNPALKSLLTGVEMTEKELSAAFERNGLKKVAPARGDKFDPHQHQAVMEQPADDVAPGSVVAVMQTGYELFGRIVRPAMVAVTPARSAPAPDPSNGAYSQGESSGASVDTKA